eukprot:TRINITY_DN20863_c0_g1_i1.p1 TRINITY_DN20863_c0_g1~~TRINITY_DN20863_c0_g1_i1.p1  ORF type:complete len:196 (+),score=28.30 TRINITY_DN20863_c0_g1_i1:656-1243(+)
MKNVSILHNRCCFDHMELYNPPQYSALSPNENGESDALVEIPTSPSFSDACNSEGDAAVSVNVNYEAGEALEPPAYLMEIPPSQELAEAEIQNGLPGLPFDRNRRFVCVQCGFVGFAEQANQLNGCKVFFCCLVWTLLFALIVLACLVSRGNVGNCNCYGCPRCDDDPADPCGCDDRVSRCPQCRRVMEVVRGAW